MEEVIKLRLIARAVVNAEGDFEFLGVLKTLPHLVTQDDGTQMMESSIYGSFGSRAGFVGVAHTDDLSLLDVPEHQADFSYDCKIESDIYLSAGLSFVEWIYHIGLCIHTHKDCLDLKEIGVFSLFDRVGMDDEAPPELRLDRLSVRFGQPFMHSVCSIAGEICSTKNFNRDDEYAKSQFCLARLIAMPELARIPARFESGSVCPVW